MKKKKKTGDHALSVAICKLDTSKRQLDIKDAKKAIFLLKKLKRLNELNPI